MADSFVSVPNTGAAKVDTEQLTVNAETVERQRFQVAGTTAASIAAVLNSAPSTEYGVVTRNIPSGTQAISASSLPLPTGASTEASLAKLTVAQGAALGSNTQAMVGGSVTTSAPSYTNGQISPISLTTAGRIRSETTLVDGDGTVADVLAGSTGPQTSNTSLVVSISPNGMATGQAVWNIAALSARSTTGTDGALNNTATDRRIVDPKIFITSTTITSATVQLQGAAGSGGPWFTLGEKSIGASASEVIEGQGYWPWLRANISAIVPNTGTVSAELIGSSVGRGARSIDTDPGSTEFGVITRNIPSGTQAISAASLPLPSGAATSAKQPALGTAGSASTDVITVQGIASMTALKVDGSAVTQPVSGTVTANVGTTNGLALDATLTGGTVRTKITDGTNNAAVKAASTAAAAADPAVVVSLSPNSPISSPAIGAVLSTTPSSAIMLGAQDPGNSLRKVTVSDSDPLTSDYALVVRGHTIPNGPVAHDGADSSSFRPLKIGARAQLGQPTAVSADGDITNIWADRNGRQVVAAWNSAQVALDTTGATASGPKVTTLTTTSDVALVSAQGAGLSIYVTLVTISNTSSTATRVDLKDGTTIRCSMMAAADGGGAVIPFNVPWKITANTAFNGALGTGVTDVRVTVHYFVAA